MTNGDMSEVAHRLVVVGYGAARPRGGRGGTTIGDRVHFRAVQHRVVSRARRIWNEARPAFAVCGRLRVLDATPGIITLSDTSGTKSSVICSKSCLVLKRGRLQHMDVAEHGRCRTWTSLPAALVSYCRLGGAK
jgi:hypothetical protein